MSGTWSRAPIPVRQICSFTNAIGEPVALDTPPAGAALTHYHDPDRARAWFAYAKLTASAWASLDDSNFRTQMTVYVNIGRAIMNGYNALNIPWHTDPEARRLWREYLSGPATPTTARILETEFGQRGFYGGADDWFRSNEAHPRMSQGSIPRITRASFLSLYPRRADADLHPLQLCLPPMPRTVPLNAAGEEVRAPGLFDDPDVVRQIELERFADWANAWPDFGTFASEYMGQDFCVNSQTGVRVSQDFLRDEQRAVMQSIEQGGPLTWMQPAPNWKYMSFNTAIAPFGRDIDPRIPLKCSPALVWFFPWLLAWADSVAARTPQDIIVCSRAYVVWRNAQQVLSMGGPEAFLRAAAGSAPDLYAQMNRESPIATAAQGVIGAVGGALSAPTFGISALVAGAAIGTIGILNGVGAFDQGVQNRGRDDLGRYKPSFERGWLSGNPFLNIAPASQLLADAPAPAVRPRDDTAHLFTLRPSDAMNWAAIMATMRPDQLMYVAPDLQIRGFGSRSDTPPGDGFPWVPIAIGAGVLYLGYRLFFTQR